MYSHNFTDHFLDLGFLEEAGSGWGSNHFRGDSCFRFGSDSPKVYVRNLGPLKLSLGFEKQRDTRLWHVFIGEEYFEVIEVEELGEKDNELEVYEIVCLRLEPKEASGFKRVVVYGPGATLADPPTKAEKTYSSGHGGLKGFLSKVFSKAKEKLTSAWNYLKEKGSKFKNKLTGLSSKVRSAIASGYDRFKRRMRPERVSTTSSSRGRARGRERFEGEKGRESQGSFISKLKGKLKSGISWLKKKLKSGWRWCKRHKKELAIFAIISLATIITAGAAELVLGGAVFSSTSASSAFLVGSAGGAGAAALSFGGSLSISSAEAFAIGFAATVTTYYAANAIKRFISEPPEPPMRPEPSLPTKTPEDIIITPPLGPQGPGTLNPSQKPFKVPKHPMFPEHEELEGWIKQLMPKAPSIEGVLRELEREGPAAPREEMHPRTHIMSHDPKHVEYSKKKLKEWGIVKEGEIIKDTQRTQLAGDLQTKDKIIEIEVEPRPSEIWHIIRQSMGIIEKHPNKKLFFQFVPKNLEKPTTKIPERIIKLLHEIGAKPVPGTNGELWEFPRFSEQTFRNYYRYIIGEDPSGEANTIIKALRKIIASMPYGSERKNAYKILLRWVTRFIVSKPAD
ncbi:MAG TPA: hypothetical protein EYP68_04370 [Candidatus Korarchaeota archaeon]|nr:hypothetical protein [Candidatus Korarchaeota archaeon]